VANGGVALSAESDWSSVFFQLIANQQVIILFGQYKR